MDVLIVQAWGVRLGAFRSARKCGNPQPLAAGPPLPGGKDRAKTSQPADCEVQKFAQTLKLCKIRSGRLAD